MNTRRKVLKLLGSGLVLCAGMPASADTRAAPDITVYYSPD